VQITLDDGVTIAIDWHFVVFQVGFTVFFFFLHTTPRFELTLSTLQEVLDILPLSVIVDHPSMDKHFLYQVA
jgi:hypothetical protein